MYKVLIVCLPLLVAAAHAQRFDVGRPPVPPPSVAAPTSQGRRDAICTIRNGRYPLPGQCDSYVQCRDWVAEEMMCPDGLRFRQAAHPDEFPCGYPIEVTCHERAALQPPKPTADCPHQYGYYRTGNERNCGVYRNCVEGRGYDFHCPEGLAYDSSTYRCEWPDLVADCDAEAFVGFRCPARALGDDGGVLPASGNAYHKHERDCRKYYTCVNGKPRLLSCEAGRAFDELTAQCEDADTVAGCRV